MNFDLGGYTVTGYIRDLGADGNVIYNGTITCNTSASTSACLFVYADPYIRTAQWRAHHLTLNQQHEYGTAMNWEQDNDYDYTSGGSGLGTPFRIDHVSSTSMTGTGLGGRYTNLTGGGHGSAEWDHNYVHCTGGDLHACQGIGTGRAVTAYIHNNQIVMDAVNVSVQAGRGVNFMPEADNGHPYIYNNAITVTNNMGIRIWGNNAGLTETGSIHHNALYNIQTPSTLGAIYIGENDTNESIMDFAVYNNTVEVHSNHAVMVDSAYGVNIYDNVLSCYNNDCSSAGWVLRTDEKSFGNNLTAVTIKNTTLPANWGSKNAVLACGPGEPSGYNCMAPTHTTSVTYCNTGTVVGNGTKTQSCP